jgi:hypothetical protein
MKLTHEKIVHLSHVLCAALERAPGTRLLAEHNQVRLGIVRLLKAEMQMEEEIERRVTAKIHSLRRGVPEGSPEWDILYRKYYDEETAKYRAVRE